MVTPVAVLGDGQAGLGDRFGWKGRCRGRDRSRRRVGRAVEVSARIVRDDAVGVAPVDLVVEVHVGDGQVPFTTIIIAKTGGGERRKLRGLRRLRRLGIGASGDELVRGVVLVGGDQQSAAEAGAGFADGATERVFVGTTPTRRIETRRAFYHY